MKIIQQQELNIRTEFYARVFTYPEKQYPECMHMRSVNTVRVRRCEGWSWDLYCSDSGSPCGRCCVAHRPRHNVKKVGLRML